MTHNSYPRRHSNTQNRPPVYSPITHFHSQNPRRIPNFQLHQQQPYSNVDRNYRQTNISHTFNTNNNIRYQPQSYIPYSTNNYRSSNTHHHSQSSSNSNTNQNENRNYRRDDQKYKKSSKKRSKRSKRRPKESKESKEKKKEYPITHNPSLIEYEDYFIDKHGTDENIPETIVFSPHYLSFNEIPLPITKHPTTDALIFNNTCFNCGSDEHQLQKCKYPRDSFCINFNRHLYETYTNAKRAQKTCLLGNGRRMGRKMRYYNNGSGNDNFSFTKTLLKQNEKKSEMKSKMDLDKNENKAKDENSTANAFPSLKGIPKLRIFRTTSDILDGKKDDEESEAVFLLEMNEDRDHRRYYSGKNSNSNDCYRDRRSLKREYEKPVMSGGRNIEHGGNEWNENRSRSRKRKSNDYQYRRAINRRDDQHRAR